MKFTLRNLLALAFIIHHSSFIISAHADPPAATAPPVTATTGTAAFATNAASSGSNGILSYPSGSNLTDGIDPWLYDGAGCVMDDGAHTYYSNSSWQPVIDDDSIYFSNGNALTDGEQIYSPSGTPIVSTEGAWIGAALTAAQLGTKIYVASQVPGIHLDGTCVATNGDVGTDDAAVINAFLVSMEAGGGGVLYMDGCSLVGSTIKLWSHERIIGVNRDTCGFHLKRYSFCPVITNGDRSTTIGGDTDLGLENLTVNGYGQYPGGVYNQSATWNSSGMVTGTLNNFSFATATGDFINAVDFNGVSHVKLRRVQIVDSPKFAIRITSAQYVDVEDLRSFWNAPNGNNDGIHFNAPYSDVNLSKIWTNGLDDGVALNGDECYNIPVVGASGTSPWPDTTAQGSARVTVRDVTAANSYSAVRILDQVGRAEDYLIDGVHGWTAAFGVRIDNGGFNQGFGNLGSIVIKNYDVATPANPTGYSNRDFWNNIYCGMKVDNLSIDAEWQNAADQRPMVYLAPTAKIRNLDVKLRMHDENWLSVSGSIGRIDFNGAWVHKAHVLAQWTKPINSGTSGGILFSKEAGRLDDLTLDGVSTNNGAALFVETGGTTTTLLANNINDALASGTAIQTTGTITNLAWGGGLVAALSSGTVMNLSGTGTMIVQGLATPATGLGALVAAYELQEGSNCSRADSSPNFGPPLIPFGGPVGQVTSGTTTFASMASFTGTGVLAGPHIMVGGGTTVPGSFTVAAWVKAASTPNMYICAQWADDGGGFTQWQLYTDYHGWPTFNIAEQTTNQNRAAQIGSALSANTLHLVIGEWNAATYTVGVSVDGGAFTTTTLVPGTNNDSGVLRTSTAPFVVGSYELDGTGSGGYLGISSPRASTESVGPIFIFNGVLSAGNAATLYSQGMP